MPKNAMANSIMKQANDSQNGTEVWGGVSQKTSEHGFKVTYSL